ncbi:MAG: sulfatase-like hydrolase/transferase [Woeseiaceae bacterium]
MTFFLVLALTNIGCFLPLYLLNLREQANPFAFLKGKVGLDKTTMRLFYARLRFSDPFRISFDYTFLLLVAVYMDLTSNTAAVVLGIVLAVGFIEILYTSIMRVIFKRAPSLYSDLSLLRTGWSVAHNYRYALLLAVAVTVIAVFIASILITQRLLGMAPAPNFGLLLLATVLIPPCIYNWDRFRYSAFLWRVVYSPTLHMLRNLRFSRQTQEILDKDEKFFTALNRFSDVALTQRPNVILVCVESYGSILYKDPQFAGVVTDRAQASLQQLISNGYGTASNFSASPIFAGGSWLSFSTLTYGMQFNDAHVHDNLFGRNSAFGSYESLFHILERNGYSNNLLCPLGGVSSRYVNWGSIDRCFRPQRKFDYDSLNFAGTNHDFFVQNDLFAPPDQYSLNFAYETLKDVEPDPFSLFFCTLNSHYPWTSDVRLVDNWKSLNDPAIKYNRSSESGNQDQDYKGAISYQLEYILDFAARNADDDLLLVIFGDHQPPFITAEDMGKETPVHIISRHPKLLQHFTQHGFSNQLDLCGETPAAIKHEGFLSLLIGAMSAAHGATPDMAVPYQPDGTRITDV